MKKILLLNERSKLASAIALFLIILLISALLVDISSYAEPAIDTATDAATVTDKLIRFHVVANSDDPDDQRLKNSIRDDIIEYIKPILDKSTDINMSRKIIHENLDVFESIASDKIKSWGRDYKVEANLGIYTFPAKAYGNVVLPGGDYEALKINIGQAAGQNWWCVMFPPLCFVDVTHNKVNEETQKELHEALSPEQNKVEAAEETAKPAFKIRFKIFDFFKRSSSKLFSFIK